MATTGPSSRRTTGRDDSKPSTVPMEPLAYRPDSSLATIMTRSPTRTSRVSGAGLRLFDHSPWMDAFQMEPEYGSEPRRIALTWSARALVAASVTASSMEPGS